MADSKKNSIIMLCSIVACVVTLLTCGTLIGNMQGTQKATSKAIGTLQIDVKHLSEGHANMKSKQAYLEGVVSTKLDIIQSTVLKMGLQVDDLMRAD